mgnify:CR=1 FL=1
MKVILILTALSLSSAMAQFGWDDEPAVGSVRTALDEFDAVLQAPVIEPIDPVIDPVAAIFQPFVSPVLDADPLVDECGIEPQVATALRASALSESTRHPSQVTSLPVGRLAEPRLFGEADADCPTYLGRLSANPYEDDSTANPYSSAGSPYSAKSVNNRFGSYGSPFSPTSARNPYATDAPKIVAQDGTCLGKLSENCYDPDSVSNPYGRYGSPYSPTSINNPYSTYGSRFSPQSPNNPYATQAPLLFGD